MFKLNSTIFSKHNKCLFQLIREGTPYPFINIREVDIFNSIAISLYSIGVG